MKTEFSFKSTAFNCTEPKDYFINPGCFGDDLAGWMIGELNARGMKTMEAPGQEDFGWYFTFWVEGIEHCVVLGFQPNDASTGDQWLGWIERQVGFFLSITGGRKRGILPAAVGEINDILMSSKHISDLTWDDHR